MKTWINQWWCFLSEQFGLLQLIFSLYESSSFAFSLFLKLFLLSMSLISLGKLFQSWGPLKQKLLVLVLYFAKGVRKWWGSEWWLLRFLSEDSLSRDRRFLMGLGALLCITSWIRVELWWVYRYSSPNIPSFFILGSVWDVAYDLQTVLIDI